MIGEGKLEDLYDETIVPMLLEMNLDQYGYFCLGALVVMLSISRAVIEGEDMLQTMGEIETEALKLDREALATRVLMLGAFLDGVKAKRGKEVQ